MTGARSLSAVVVDDSLYMRTTVTDVLEEGGIDVVGTAENGREAVAAVRRHGPDLVTMDVEMPEVDGLEAVERIMADAPTPILMLSSHTETGSDVTFEALRRGAVDVHPKPDATATGIYAESDAIVRKARAVAAADVSGTGGGADTAAPEPVESSSPRGTPILLVGASTGGPAVVERLLATLPLEAQFRVLVVQHMVPSFTGRFADRLDATSEYDVREASDGDRMGAGEALVVPGDHHLVVSGLARGRLRVALNDDPPRHGVRPAIDTTFESVADTVGSGGDLVAVVLTGMGRDGCAGAGAVSRAGGTVLVQDEASAVVDGMPGAVVEAGHADAVLRTGRLVPRAVDAVTENGEVEL